MSTVNERGGMKALCGDLVAECVELRTLTAPLDAAGWRTPTPFYAWTIYDEIAHLCLFDEVAVLAARDQVAFRSEQASLEATLANGMEVSEFARQRYAHLDGASLGEFWRSRYLAVAEHLAMLDPKARLPWFGPDMSARSFVTARLMETWAHGQDVYDALGVSRLASPRLRHVAHLGVLTFGWSFINRGLTPPPVAPLVELSGPAGERWTWGQPSAAESVRGSALDFCWVVTQRRHYLDTRLEVTGDVAREWMRLAQCFAGPPVMGPAPGALSN
jgi:uncharacterized protein (TIGR03084 family)